MCGLFAGVGKLNSNRIVSLGSMNEDRGTDSTGLAYLKSNEIIVEKIAERAAVALNLSLRKAVTEAALSGMFIGHTRLATKGTICSANAHPFLIDGIVFAHNGIIGNDKDFGDYTVDSMSLIHGIKAKDFSKYRGCIALIWIEAGKLQAYRSGNPLYRGRHAGSTYLASEEEQLKAIGCTSIKELKEGFIYTFHSENNITTQKVKENQSYLLPHYLDYMSELDKSYKQISEPNVPENFNTWKDDRPAGKHCILCADEIPNGNYCIDCMEWETEILGKDLPSVVDVSRYQR